MVFLLCSPDQSVSQSARPLLGPPHTLLFECPRLVDLSLLNLAHRKLQAPSSKPQYPLARPGGRPQDFDGPLGVRDDTGGRLTRATQQANHHRGPQRRRMTLTFDFCLSTPNPVLTTSTCVVAWPQGDQGGSWGGVFCDIYKRGSIGRRRRRMSRRRRRKRRRRRRSAVT